MEPAAKSSEVWRAAGKAGPRPRAGPSSPSALWSPSPEWRGSARVSARVSAGWGWRDELQQRNPIRSGKMIKGEVSARREWREPRQLPARGARAPPGLAGAGAAQPAEQPEARSRAPDSPPFPPRDPSSSPSCGRTPGSLTVSQKRQQRGQEQQGCREHGVGGSRARVRAAAGGRGARWGAGRRGAQSGVRRGEGAGPPPSLPPPAPDRISTTASAWRRRRGSPSGPGGGGARGAAYRKVSSKGAEDPAAGAQGTAASSSGEALPC